jgi:hypothetical protein
MLQHLPGHEDRTVRATRIVALNPARHRDWSELRAKITAADPNGIDRLRTRLAAGRRAPSDGDPPGPHRTLSRRTTHRSLLVCRNVARAQRRW